MLELNPHQDRAVQAVGHCTVLACPGSGKTRVLSMRAARLLSENPTGRLCAVTFTRDAAKELKNRTLQLCGEKEAKRLAVGTFHSVALSQIRHLKGYADTRLLSDGERIGLLRRCYAQYKCDTPFDKVISAIDQAKSKLGTPIFEDVGVEDIFEAYQGLLVTEGVMDFSDILLKVVRGIKAETIRPLPVRWLLADEFQDADEVQTQWVIQHGQSGVEITIVGDDDQSLYAFRNAMGYEGMLRVSQLIVSQEITLPVNYRCAPNILNHAATLIAHNPVRANKAIKPFRDSTGIIKVHRLADRYDEASNVVKAIQADSAKSWAILARTNSLLETAEAELITKGIPYRISGGKSVWSGMVGSALLGLLKSLQSDHWTGMANALSLCGIKAELLNIDHHHKTCDEMLQIILKHVTANEDTRAQKVIESISKGIKDWRQQINDGNVSLVVYAASNWLAERAKSDRGGLIKMLANTIARLKGTLAQRLNTLTRLNDSDTDSTTKVTLSTLHASKGLEFDCVWILAAEDNNLPHPDSTEDEERRLFYVGMTRARDRLEISSSLEDGLVSRFVQEAGL